MKHTPGPWHWVNSRNDQPYNFQTQEGSPSLRTIAEYGENKTTIIDGKRYTSFALPIFVLTADEIESEDDARLIAAAPDLLAALELIAGALSASLALEYVQGIARAAIAKATVES